MRVLVVDDEPALRESLRRGLVAGGWAVDTAADGEAGLEMAAGDEYDVVVLDIMMPRRNGYEVVREMRRLEIWTPVLMLTAK
ncbi:response regulator, partial [Acinetobacter baumannii]|nr:response regulator [Acinetobacter baumannii]